MARADFYADALNAPPIRDPGGQYANPMHETHGGVGDGSADDRAALLSADAEDAPMCLPAGFTFKLGSDTTLSGAVVGLGAQAHRVVVGVPRVGHPPGLHHIPVGRCAAAPPIWRIAHGYPN